MARRYRLELRYGAIACALVAGLVLFNKLHVFSGLDTFTQGVLRDSKDLGLLAVFVIALVANVSLLVQVPYTIPLLAAAIAGAQPGRMLVLGIAAAIGASIGGLISYLIAEKILARRPALEASRLYGWVMRTTTARPRLASFVVFLGVATPVPDDAVILPLAMVHHGVRKLAPALVAGKLVHNVAVALVFYQFTAWATSSASTHVRADLVVGAMLLFLLMIGYQAEKARSTLQVATVPVVADLPVAALARGSDARSTV